MKPKRTQRHTGPNWQGKGVSVGDRATLSQAKPTCVPPPAQVRPFVGKVFYLDLPSNRIAETLESDIKYLGGTVEKFFSKEIKYLVTNKREARYVQCLKQDSPVPSPESGPSSPHPPSNQHRPGSCGDNVKSKSHSQIDTVVTSRGKSLVERVVKEQERLKINKILSNALEWGVKILYIDDIMAYVQKKKKAVSGQCPIATAVKTSVKAERAVKQGFHKFRGERISKPFIKVEDSSRHYRPIYFTMPNIPEFNLKTVPPFSPFCVEEKVPGNKQLGNGGAKASVSEERAHGRKKNKDKKRGGYCECCMLKYENVTTHLNSDRHKAFSKSDEYLVVDKLASTLHCNFSHIRTQVKRPKCSVSSVVVVPGLCGKTVQRHKRDADTTEIITEEESYSAPGSGERRSCLTQSDRSKHKSLARKRPRRQTSLTSCTQTAEQIETEPKMETAPSRGECPSSVPSRVTQVNEVDHTVAQDVNISASHSHNVSVQNEASSQRLDVITNLQEGSDKKLDEAAQEGDMLADNLSGNRLSGRGEVSPPSQNFSPVRKIQRRVKVYKRKRRKKSACINKVTHVEQSDMRDNSMLKLWEIFQSSDDMDVEFLGFPD